MFGFHTVVWKLCVVQALQKCTGDVIEKDVSFQYETRSKKNHLTMKNKFKKPKLKSRKLRSPTVITPHTSGLN